MQIRFWGVRGSSPTPFREYLGYGGNTSCVEIRTAAGDVCIFDAGTGLRTLGKRLINEFGHTGINALVFLSHYHWDHIQGIPMCEPLYNPDNHFHFYSFPSAERSVKDALEDQMRDPYFPVRMDAMSARRYFNNLADDILYLEGGIIQTKPLNHPQGCLGYRVESNGHCVVYATDNEPGVREYDRNVRDLAEGADVLIYDSQYTPLEYTNFKKGWGHSTWREAVDIARQAKVGKLVLYHHDPDHDDAFLDRVVWEASRHFPEVYGASEGLEIDLGANGHHVHTQLPNRRSGSRHDVSLPVVVQGRTAGGLRFVEHTVLENLSINGGFFRLKHTPDPRNKLDLDIKFAAEPSAEALAMKVEAEVLRSERTEDEPGSHVAVRFLSQRVAGRAARRDH